MYYMINSDVGIQQSKNAKITPRISTGRTAPPRPQKAHVTGSVIGSIGWRLCHPNWVALAIWRCVTRLLVVGTQKIILIPDSCCYQAWEAPVIAMIEHCHPNVLHMVYILLVTSEMTNSQAGFLEELSLYADSQLLTRWYELSQVAIQFLRKIFLLGTPWHIT